MALEYRPEQLFDGTSELRLINATELIRKSTEDDSALALKALTFLRLRATQQDTEAKTKLSTIYAEGSSPFIQKDQREADLWSRSVFDKQLSCALYACSADLADNADGFSTMDLILEGAKARRPHLCYLVGLLLSKGIGLEQDIEEGIRYLQQAAEDGQADAAYELGRVYSDRYSYSKNNMAQSLLWYEKALEHGDTRALVDLAYGFYEGSPEVQKDDARAFRYAEMGAKANDKYCQYILGNLYLKGRGTPENAQEAIKWLATSVEQGFTLAIEDIATVYLRGSGNVEKNFERAYEWCKRGESNITFCQTALGDIYRNGWSVQRNYQKAFEYYQTAASQPDAPHHYAQHMLGEMFLNGEGIPQDIAVAKEWFQIAASQGYEPSRQKLQILAATKSIQPQQDAVQKNGNTSSSGGDSPQPQEKRPSRWSLSFLSKKK
ncbi:hypothetical protein DFQ28_006264 [Apophysomyces sp. BC1034]|nr:hypothetical protein DFQ30_004407 [Apophysomyces sp. BC1015]KAG0180439.1 hypothetical protein DFQ29_000685 [Apophysomyces sp. BC1021]KAG0187509.1 hypothetical protein DFQ28_006264 [Apophysomyces sp. BC1034]